MIKIAKFGGSSVADAKHFRQIKKIVDADPSRRFVVVSACGRRYKSDAKVTDLLYLVAAHVRYHVSCDDLLEDIGKRYFDIAEELGLNYPIHEEFAAFAERARAGELTTEELVSRGEYFTAQLMAEYLGLPFLDAADVVAFHHDGSLSMTRTHALIQERGIPGGFVMPGFYGATREGQIKLLDRGGGDISGSILAKCLEADLYENWTDVSGFLSADPRIVEHPQPIGRITYQEMRELSYMGASVLHEEAVFPVMEAGIPIAVKNTNRPLDPGTIISDREDFVSDEPIITGVTGKRNFVAVHIFKDHMSNEVGYLRRVLSIFERYRVSIEHIPSGIDSFAVVVRGEDVKDSLWSIVADIKREVEPDKIKVVRWNGNFNYSKIVNFGVAHASGDYLLLLNNDTEVISDDFIPEMLGYLQRPEVGVVGAKLYFADGLVQHAGMIVGAYDALAHANQLLSPRRPGYLARAVRPGNFSAVTGACQMVRRDVFEKVGGYDESFAVGFNDADFCLRARRAGYLTTFTPYAELYHYEFASRGRESADREKLFRWKREQARFIERWPEFFLLGCDPYYSPNLKRDNAYFALAQ